MIQAPVATRISDAALPKSPEVELLRRCERAKSIAESPSMSARAKLSLLGDEISSILAPVPHGTSGEAPLVAVTQAYTSLLGQLSERNSPPASFRGFLEKQIISAFNSCKYRFSAARLSSMLIACSADPAGLGRALSPVIATRLAEKMHELPPSELCRCLSDSGLVGLAPRIAVRMAQQAATRQPAASTPELLKMAQALAKEKACNIETIELLSRAFESRIPRETPLWGAKMVSAIRELCDAIDAGPEAPHQPSARAFYAEWAGRLSSPDASVTTQVAALIAEGLSKGIQPKDACRPALAALAHAAEAQSGPQAVTSLIELAKVLATFEIHDAVIPAMIASRLGDRLHVLDDASLASLVGSFGRLGWRDDAFLAKARDAAVARLAGSSLDGKLAADLVVGFQRLGIRDRALAEAATGFLCAREPSLANDDLYRALFAVSYMEPSCLAGKLTASGIAAVGNPQSARKGHNAMLLADGLRAVQAAPGEFCLETSKGGNARPAATNDPKELEAVVVQRLSEALRTAGAQDLKVIRNATLCGAEVDVVVITKHKRYIIELDGAEHHELYGPSAHPGQRSGHDEAQDMMFKALKYGVFHLSAKEARAGGGGAIRAIAEAIASDGERLKDTRPPDYPERFAASAAAA